METTSGSQFAETKLGRRHSGDHLAVGGDGAPRVVLLVVERVDVDGPGLFGGLVGSGADLV